MITEKERRIRKQVAKNMKFYRHLHGWSQSDLAKLLGVERTVVASWETTYAFPSNDMLIHLVDTLQAGSIDDFCRKEAKVCYRKAA